MVQTRSIAKLTQRQQVDDNDGISSRDDAVEQVQLPPRADSDTPPPTKKRRAQRTETKKTRRGEPFNSSRLNLDVLWHVCSFLCPMDVLNLARTCKYFRWILMSKSSASIWKTALHHVEGLPDCPADLSEPEYTNLVFYPRCHGCGKYTPAIFWRIRRRYCPECRVARLFRIESFPRIIWGVIMPIAEDVSLSKEKRDMRFDKGQINSWLKEYEDRPEEEFLANKQKHHYAIKMHAEECAEWHKLVASNRKNELRARRQERANSILERLEQLGYKREIDYYGPDYFWKSHKLTSRLLTNEEWARILPDWLKTMNDCRQLRLERTVFRSRRLKLESEYKRYMAQSSPDPPSFDFLPHVADLARFPPFQDIIEAPEETTLGDHPFASTFAQLPLLVDKWRKQLDAELARLVNIPHLASDDTCDTGVASNCTNHVRVAQADSDKLQLACALFYAGYRGVFTHPEVLLTCMAQHNAYHDVSGPIGSIQDQLGITFLDEAPYIVHACGLDPNVATVDDMDCRNARLKCLCCTTRNPLVMNWRVAMMHAYHCHRSGLLAPLSGSPRWKLVNDEWVGAIQAAESVDFKPIPLSFMRCLLCPPCVGAAMFDSSLKNHHAQYHQVMSGDLKLGVHYADLVGIGDPCSTCVEMVEEGGQVTFQRH